MNFASIEYAVLLSLVFVTYWAFGQRSIGRTALLLIASYGFYAWWSAYYLLLIVASSALDYGIGWRLHHAGSTPARKRWLALSVIGNLGLLATFKYFNFFAGSFAAAASALGIACDPWRLDVALPVGISFFTFQSMSYTIDIYRRQLEPTRDPLLFAVYVAFFPQLVAGPIVRARYFLPQLSVNPSLDSESGSRAFGLIASGLLKKLLIADLLAVHLVERVFETPQLYTSMELLIGIYGFAFQIYCDFSAYSDLAIGSALLLGLKIPPNFAHPYLALNLRDFWRRWHISLSTWLRDYLYIPLGGSRHGSVAMHRNLALTMLLGGLWHGAAWNFVAWGALHALGLSATHFWHGRRRASEATSGPAAQVLGMLATFHFVCLAWVLFRAPTLGHACQIVTGLGRFSSGLANITPLVWAVLSAAVMTHLTPAIVRDPMRRAAVSSAAPIQATAILVLIAAARYLGTTEVAPFIYFQF